MPDTPHVILVIPDGNGPAVLTSRGVAEIVTLDTDDPRGHLPEAEVLDDWGTVLEILTELGQGPGSRLYEVAAEAIAYEMDGYDIPWTALGRGLRGMVGRAATT